MLTGLFLFVKILSMGSAAFLFFHRAGNPFAEAASYAIIIVFMLLSFVQQISFIAGMPILSAGMEIFRLRSSLFNMVCTLKIFGSANPISFTFLGLCLVFISFFSLLSVPAQFQTNFYRLAVYGKNGFFPLAVNPDFPPFSPVNHIFVFHTWMQDETFSGIGILCFSAYLSTGFSTYALARHV